MSTEKHALAMHYIVKCHMFVIFANWAKIAKIVMVVFSIFPAFTNLEILW